MPLSRDRADNQLTGLPGCRQPDVLPKSNDFPSHRAAEMPRPVALRSVIVDASSRQVKGLEFGLRTRRVALSIYTGKGGVLRTFQTAKSTDRYARKEIPRAQIVQYSEAFDFT
jgi:hypothetical protein